MELCSLHPFDEAAAHEFVQRVSGNVVIATSAGSANINAARGAIDSIAAVRDRGRYELTYAFARELAGLQPTYFHPGVSLTTWEARVDRGIGMLMRPPSRLFIDAGLEPSFARTLPIRLDVSRGMMGGAYIPARLTGELERLLEARLERSVRRLIEAEWDGVAVLGLMLEMAAFARSNRLAVYEAIDVVSPDGIVPGIPEGRVIAADKRRLDKALFQQLATNRWIAEHRGLLVTGPCGVGKSWLSCALAQKACRDGYTVHYARVPRLFADLDLAHGDGRFARLFRMLVKVDLLVLDDWGPDRLSPSQRRDLMEIVEDRHGRGRASIVVRL